LNSAAALRGSFLAMDQGKISEYAGAVFRAYWENLEDVSDRAVLVRIAIEVGIDPVRFVSQLEAPETRERLAENTNEIMQRGGFGTPTFFVNGSEMYFGNDRLDLLKEAIRV
jgi:2-hydroxychromene-2-carboxylate isomerase